MVPDRTLHGVLHDLFGTPVFLGLPVACCVVAYRFASARRKGWAAYSVGTAVAFLTGFVLTSMGLAQPPLIPPVGGLLQRLTIIIGWTWLTALALHLLRRAPGWHGPPAEPRKQHGPREGRAHRRGQEIMLATLHGKALESRRTDSIHRPRTGSTAPSHDDRPGRRPPP
jgi:hypothetical protein